MRVLPHGWPGLVVLLVAVATACSEPSSAELAARVIVVANARDAESVALARFYAEQRGVPAGNIITLPLPMDETVSWRQFVDEIFQPLQDELHRQGWLTGAAGSGRDRLGRKRYAFTGHRIAYLVVCRGVPLRIAHDPALLGPRGRLPEPLYRNGSAVDAELSLLALGDYEITGLLRNPLFESAVEPAMPVVVKVSRLDGPTAESARHLVIAAQQAEARGVIGRYYLDQGGPHADGDRWLAAVGRELSNLAFEGDVEATPARFAPGARFDAPAFYFGWYEENLAGPLAPRDFRFPAGAIAMHIHSFSAATLRSTTRGWCGPLVARGAAATVGNVDEPYLEFTHRPDLLVRALAEGKNFGDAVYYALPVLSWQAVAIGDPLYQPFKVSLQDQGRRDRELEPAESAYVVARAAQRLKGVGRSSEAIALLRSVRSEGQTDVWRLALMEHLVAAGEHRQAAEVAQGFDSLDGASWPLVRRAAEVLGRSGESVPALRLYAELSRAAAPTPAAREELLRDAAEIAERAGDAPLAAEFDRQRAAAR